MHYRHHKNNGGVLHCQQNGEKGAQLDCTAKPGVMAARRPGVGWVETTVLFL